MDFILIILGIIGFGAIVISAYLLLVAARNYASNDDYQTFCGDSRVPAQRPLAIRSPTDRRSDRHVTFPLAVNGILIAQDRRTLPDRRMLA